MHNIIITLNFLYITLLVCTKSKSAHARKLLINEGYEWFNGTKNRVVEKACKMDEINLSDAIWMNFLTHAIVIV